MLCPASPHVAAGPDPAGVLLMNHTPQIRPRCGQMCPVLEAKLFNLASSALSPLTSRGDFLAPVGGVCPRPW